VGATVLLQSSALIGMTPFRRGRFEGRRRLTAPAEAKLPSSPKPDSSKACRFGYDMGSLLVLAYKISRFFFIFHLFFYFRFEWIRIEKFLFSPIFFKVKGGEILVVLPVFLDLIPWATVESVEDLVVVRRVVDGEYSLPVLMVYYHAESIE
jgi:hypothetical protein